MSPETTQWLETIGAQPGDSLERLEVLASRWRTAPEVGIDEWIQRLGDSRVALAEIRRDRQKQEDPTS